MKTENISLEILRENEELFRITFEQAAVGIAHVSPKGNFIRVNQKFCDIVKYSRNEILSFNFQHITFPDDLKEDLNHLKKLLKGEIATFNREKRYICKDGTIVWVNLTVSLVRDITNEPKFIIAFVEDITNRKTIEYALAESESRYKNIIENTTDIIIVTGFDGKHLYVSPRYQELLGRTPEQIDKILIEYIHPDDQKKLKKLYIESFQKRYAPAPDTEFEFRIQHQEGHYIWVSSITKSYYNEDGDIIGVITSLRDIRKRKEAEEKWKKSELQYKNIIENTTDAITVVDLNGKPIYVSPKHEELTGRTLDEITKQTFEYIYPEDRQKLLELWNKSLKNHNVASPNTEFEYRVLHKNGSYVWFSTITNNYYDENGQIIGFITSMRNINKRKEMEEHLIESEQKYRHLFESSPYIIGLINKDGTIIDCNSSISNFFSSQKEDLIGRTIYEVFSELEENKNLIPTFQKLIDDAYSEIQGKSFEFKLYISSKQFVWLSVDSSFTEVDDQLLIQFIMQDVTEKKIIQENLEESELKFRTIAEQSFMGIVIIQDGIFKYFNDQVNEINGYSRKDIQDWVPYEFLNTIHPDDRQIASEQVKKKESGEKDILINTKYRLIKKSGEIRWIENYSKTINYGGRPADLIMSKDITEEVLADIKLKESELKFRTMAEQSFLGISILQNGIFKYYNNKMTEINGYSREDIQDWEPYEYLKIIHPDDLQNATEQARKNELGETDSLTHSKYRVITKSGDIRWTESFSKPINFKGRTADLIMSKDITEEVLADIKLKESELKFRTIAEQSFLGISILQNGVFKYYNEKMTEINGYSREDIKNWEPYEYLKIIHPEDLQNATEQAKKNELGETDFLTHTIYRIITKSGEERWTESYSKPINYEGRSADLITSKDITEEVLADIKLKESELKFRTIAEQSFMGIIIIQDGEFKYFNQRAADINGYSVDEIKKWEPYEFMKLIHPDDNNFVLDQVKKKQKGDKNVINRYQYRIVKKSGEVSWMDNYSKTITFNGRPADLVMTEDITEKILSEQQLKESELKFRKIFEANPSGMHIFDLNQDEKLIFKGANPAADKILRRGSQDKIGLTFEEAFPNLVKTDIPSKYKNVALNGESVNWEYKYNFNEFTTRTYDIYAFQTAPRSIVSSFLDITDRIEAEERLREVNKLKSDLLRRASHELKTPLTSINGATDLLLTTYQENFNDKTKKFLQIIKDGSERLENLIKDLLNVSRLNTQNVEIHKHREDIVKLMRNSIKEVEIFALERKIEIIFDQVESVYIHVDKNKILQVFANILMNAIKYTPPLGKVTVLLEIHSNNIEYFVIDTGIGFTEAEKNGLFKQFGKIERFGHGYELNTEGSGLGLYISKELVELHSGELLLESEGRNKGSTFIIRLPKL